MADSIQTLQRALDLATRDGNAEAVALLNAEIQPRIAAEGARMAAEDMGTFQRGAANVGAGMTNLWQGAKQIGAKLGIGEGVSDDELRQTRVLHRALAAASDTGTGPPRAATMGSALQFGGEVLPTLAIPAGPALRAIPAFRALPRTAQALTEGAAVGGAAGALQPVTSEESRGLNIAAGATLGAAIPGGVAAVRGVRTAWQGRAGERLLDDLAADYMRANPGASRETARAAAAAQAGRDVRGYAPQGAQDIPMSSASITQSPSIAMAERASRAADPPAWHPFDVAQNQSVWQNVERATAGADDLATREATRRSGWATREGEAMQAVDMNAFTADLARLRTALQGARRTPPGMNQMRGVLDEIMGQIDTLGPQGFTPQHLAALRSRMAGAIRGRADDVFSTAPKSDPHYIQLRNEMDAILNRATGGRWQGVLEGYRAESAPVTEAKGLGGIREKFVTPEGVIKVGELGGAPRVTEARLRQALAAGGENRFGNALTPGVRGELEGTLEALRRAQFPAQMKTTGTSGGGSNTVMDAMNVAKRFAPHGEYGMAVDAIAGAVRALTARGRRREAQELTLALQDPQRFVAMVEAAAHAGRPIPAHARQAYNLMVRGAATGGPQFLTEGAPQ